MKKIVLLLLMMLLATPAFAAKYASVDIDKVLNGYSKTQNLNTNFQKQEADIRVYMLDAQKKVVSAKTDAERKALEDKYGKELQTKMEAIQKAKLNALKDLEVDVKAAIQSVGKSGNYDLILPVTSAFYGATDISDQVIKILNTTKK